MAGIYIHIPFCKQACHYCNFHFSTTFEKYRNQMIGAICQEIYLQKDFFGSSKTQIQSVYFGGGTPSLLNNIELQQIWSALKENFDLSYLKEVTLEANPDDMDKLFFDMLSQSSINRLSIGVQSFDNLDLAYLNRVHSGESAIEAISKAINLGIEKISTDLIFGIPTSGISRLEKDIRRLANLGVNHISVYGLTIEKNTALDLLIKKKKSIPVNEEKSAEEMEWLMEFMPSLGYQQYEISNFALPGEEAIHNNSYWHNIPYLGIGPSAHSYKAPYRSWNIANNMQYIRNIEQGELPQENEILDLETQYNEWIMTHLRLKEGVQIQKLEEQFGYKIFKHFISSAEKYLQSEFLLFQNNHFILSNRGKLMADNITSDLFL
ncbi:MAG: radical SAM family heme chaperone HemW [Chitinophagales bacterium]|nr:radical SAM family heme chaperone HemW [Chitinophagales bacterium]MCZ2392677.1 radical SAM family heme chaperone HemW [Chitinophagales bacterium]